MKKRILSVLLVLVMLFGMLPTAALAADTDVPTSGTCGDNATWSYDADTKTLTVSGTGAVDNAAYSDYASEIEAVVINSGITSLCDEAFGWEYAALKTVTMADTVKTIGDYGFAYTAITNTDFLSDGVSIGEGCFMGCTSMTSAVIPSGCKSLPDSAFSDSESIAQITLPDGLEKIGKWALSGIKGTETITIPSTVTFIDSAAFEGWSVSKTILFPEGYPKATVDSFPAGWSGNATVKIGSLDITPTSGPCGDNAMWSYDAESKTLTISGTGAIQDYPFHAPWGTDGESYANVEHLVIESGITKIGQEAFKKPDFAATLKSISLPDTLEEIAWSAFAGITGPEVIEIPKSVNKIGANVFNGWTDAQTIRFAWPQAQIADNISLDRLWDAGSKAKIEYQQLDDAYCEGISVTLKDGEKSYPGTLDFEGLKVSFTDEVDMLKDISFTDPEIIVTKDGQPWADGTASLSGALTFTNAGNGRYTTSAKLILTPAAGVQGDAVTLSMSMTVTEKTFEFQGSGTEADPYLVDSATALYQLGKKVNAGETYSGKYFLQTADIDMTGVSTWQPIGLVARNSIQRKFDATYDGGGHRIKNWTVDCSKLDDDRYFGLFGNVTLLKNLTLDASCTFALRSWSGTLAYQVTRIENCASYATVTAQTTSGDNSNASIGGLIKLAESMENCANYGSVTVTGGGTVGGVASAAYNVANCYNYGTVTAGGAKVGGIVAELSAFGNTPEAERGVMSGCGNAGAVTGGTNVGGLAGVNEGILEDCYNVGAVEATDDGAVVGGLVGAMSTSSNYTDKLGVFNSYHAGSVAYKAGDGAALAGHLIGRTQGRGNADERIGKLYYQQIGVLPAVGNESGLSGVTAMELADMKSAAFADTLNDYKNISLRGAAWAADTAGANGGLPVITSTEVLKNYENKITTLTLNDQNAIAGENDTFSCLTLPYGTDLTKVAMTAQISARAAMVPASGTTLDFSQGPVTLTVTAEDGSVRTYTVTAAAAATDSGVAALRISLGTSGVENLYGNEAYRGRLLLDLGDFKPEQTAYSFRRYDAQTGNKKMGSAATAYFWAVPAEAEAVMTAAVGTVTATIPTTLDLMADAAFDSSLRFWDITNRTALTTYGRNTVTLTVTPAAGSKAQAVTYTFDIDLVPSLKNVTFAEAVTQEQTFAYDVLEYDLTVPDSVTSLTPSLTYSMSDFVSLGGKVTYQPALDENGCLNIAGLDSFKITLSVGEGDQARETTYTFRIANSSTYSMELAANAEKPQLRVYDENGALLAAENGVYSLEMGKTYSYTVVAKGYKSQSGTITGPESLTEGKLVLNLEAVESGSLPQLDAAWPSFRGNDNHMAITSAPTPRSADEAELLWGVAAGVGFDSGAVSSPIIVDGYLYAYAGKSLLKIDRSNGSVAASGTMVDSSNFAIVPPTYADGMIFVGLSKGRVQAFNAQTLESLWVYTDPLGGQPNSPIVYHDGCVYTGFWNSETRNANFVCLTVDDEDTASTTEAKQALWTYTQAGGFYWAGAFAKGQYIVVGTDDGKSGYTSATARLLVLDKDTGALVSSATGYTGDIRSNVSYDADSDRVYFTSKGGYFYSEMIDWSTGLIDASESRAIALGGMSTSTPVVYQGRAYVGVAGTSQFGAYSGHHIAVLDLDQWTVAYTAASQGYPQTSGMLTTAYAQEDGYVYVYFMDNYTPGVMRVIKDSAGQTELLDGVTENGHENCAPVVFTPEGKLAQYCICSPIADENGVIYFKNDSGYMMAVGRGQVEKNYTVTFDAQGGTADAETLETSGGVLAQLPEARKPGYTFLGWFTQAEDGEQVTTETVFTQDTTLYAHWQAVEGYTVSVGQGSSIVMGESANLTLTLRNAAETTYNAYHFVLTYDPAVLDYTGINTDATVKNENGTLTVSGYGEDRACGTDDIVLTFAAKAPGKSDVTLTGANVDKSANAVTQDAPEASIDPASALITVGGYTVTLPEDFTGAATVNEGEDYTFTAKDTHYDYTFGGSTMGGEDVTVIDNGDGTFTVKNVTGDIVIRSEKTPKQYAVTVEGTGAADTEAPATATYGVDYGFNVNENAAYTYTVSATVDGAPAALVNNGSGSYTISGASVTGSIVITVEKTAKPVTTTQITFVGEGSADVVGGTTQTAPNGADFRFRLNKAEGYDYTVKLDGAEMVPEEDGSYVIPGSMLTGAAVTVTVEKTARQSITLEVSEYIRLDGTTMWLVTAAGTVSQDKTLAYDGTPMFWSDKYQAYAYLVISEKTADEVKADAAERIAEAAAERTDILYDFDVNATGLVDINDAQLVYDMYNAKFASFDLVPMARFLRADCNGDKTVSTLDAAAIVNHLLNG